MDQDDTTRAIDESVAVAAKYWWLLLVSGIVGVVFGLVMLFNIAGGLRILTWLVGFYLLFTGLVELLGATSLKPRWLAIAAGILAMIGGVVTLAYPKVTIGILAVLVGFSFIVWGVAKAVAAFTSRGEGRAWSGIGGILITVVGAVLLLYPKTTVVVVSVFIGINALVFGVSAVLQSFALRRAGGDAELEGRTT